MLPLISGVAVVNSLKNFGVNPKIKWPNDVMIKNKKISGILIECFDDYCIVGIGVNVNKTPMETATSLKDEAGKNISKNVILNSILKSFEKYSEKNVLDEYKKFLCTLGRFVKIKTLKSDIEGKAIDVDEQGCLILESGERIVSGDVIHLR
jgi:BirA family biotin operon repressor/biotin-[acetyl-CoA-carboxylase] ligase